MGEFSVENMDSTVMIQDIRIGPPVIHGDCKIFIVPLTEHAFDFSKFVFIEGLSLFPDCHRAFYLLLRSSIQKVPNPLN